MKLTILGATGGVGRHLVAHALRAGHEVTALVREPSRLAADQHNLSVIVGDALDPDSVTQAIDGADAVLSAIGATGRDDPLKPASTSAQAAIEAMHATRVRRILVVSAAPLNRSGVGQSFAARRVGSPLLWRLLRDIYEDLELMETFLRDSGLEWTAVRPPRLLDKPSRGRYRRTIETGPPGAAIPRVDLARAMLHFLNDPATVRHAVGVCS